MHASRRLADGQRRPDGRRPAAARRVAPLCTRLCRAARQVTCCPAREASRGGPGRRRSEQHKGSVRGRPGAGTTRLGLAQSGAKASGGWMHACGGRRVLSPRQVARLPATTSSTPAPPPRAHALLCSALLSSTTTATATATAAAAMFALGRSAQRIAAPALRVPRAARAFSACAPACRVVASQPLRAKQASAPRDAPAGYQVIEHECVFSFPSPPPRPLTPLQVRCRRRRRRRCWPPCHHGSR